MFAISKIKKQILLELKLNNNQNILVYAFKLMV